MKKDERFKNLTLAEKARLVQGTDFMYTFRWSGLAYLPLPWRTVLTDCASR